MIIFGLTLYGITRKLIALAIKGNKKEINQLGLDSKLLEIISSERGEFDKILDVASYLSNNKDQKDSLEKNMSSTKGGKSSPPKSPLQAYKELLEDIYNYSKKDNKPLALEGFFNGPNYVFYFDPSGYKPDFEIEGNKLNAQILHRIQIEKIDDQIERQERITHQRRFVNMNTSHTFDAFKSDTYSVLYVYEYYVEIEQKDEITSVDAKGNINPIFQIEDSFVGYSTLKESFDKFVIEEVNKLNRFR